MRGCLRQTVQLRSRGWSTNAEETFGTWSRVELSGTYSFESLVIPYFANVEYSDCVNLVLLTGGKASEVTDGPTA